MMSTADEIGQVVDRVVVEDTRAVGFGYACIAGGVAAILLFGATAISVACNRCMADKDGLSKEDAGIIQVFAWTLAIVVSAVILGAMGGNALSMLLGPTRHAVLSIVGG